MKDIILSQRLHRLEFAVVCTIAGFCTAAIMSYFIHGIRTMEAAFLIAMGTLFLQAALNLLRYMFNAPETRTHNIFGDTAVAFIALAGSSVILLPPQGNIYAAAVLGIAAVLGTAAVGLTLWHINRRDRRPTAREEDLAR